MDVKNISYPPKILLAWGEAISGNAAIRDWLIQNGYPELGIFTFALRNKDDAREWLMKNGFPHLMALINGAEGNSVALEWLNRFGYPVLEMMARVGDGDERAYQWLLEKDYREFAMIAKKIEFVKDQIEMDNNDPHRISPD
ncbi:MAG: hypothetical protein K1X56_04290 [Flavobacteriales bacterium]|nr:hypothetical protein [Flavobacteriales bacterium]